MENKSRRLDPFFELETGPGIRKATAERRPLVLVLETTNACGGSCSYCLSSSAPENNYHMPTEKIRDVISDAKKIGVRHLTVPGGDPLLHPDWFAIQEWAGTELGLHSFFVTSAIISKRNAQRLVDLYKRNCIHMLGIHIDTIDPDTYAEVHLDPRTLQKKIQGYDNVLEAGFPPQNIIGLLTLTRASVKTAEQTMDWFHERGASWINLLPFKPCGFGVENREFEPTKLELKRVAEHRAELKGSEWLSVATMECGKFHCQTMLYVSADGYVMPCGFYRETHYGNIFEQSLVDIFNNHRDPLLFNVKIEGACGSCENNDVCFGCRSNAQSYLGDVSASDPKCWLNTATPELMCGERLDRRSGLVSLEADGRPPEGTSN